MALTHAKQRETIETVVILTLKGGVRSRHVVQREVRLNNFVLFLGPPKLET